MLGNQEKRHFAEHGWVLLKNYTDEDLVARMRSCLDRLANSHQSMLPQGSNAYTQRLDNLVLLDEVFRSFMIQPSFLDLQGELVGASLHYLESYALITQPHPMRQGARDHLRDAAQWNWHRGFRPKWGNFPDDEDPTLMNALFVKSILYLSNVSAGNGATAVLDGSHRLEGRSRDLLACCPIVEVEAKAGSVFVFSETLVHTGVPIVEEHTRHAAFFGFSPRWVRANHSHFELPPSMLHSLKDREIRDILGARIGYHDQQKPQKIKPMGRAV